MTSKSSDEHDDNDDTPGNLHGWSEIADNLGSTKVVYVIARYDKDGNQTDFEVDAEPSVDFYAQYGMLVHAVDLLRDVMVQGDAVVFELDDSGPGDDDADGDD